VALDIIEASEGFFLMAVFLERRLRVPLGAILKILYNTNP